MRPALVALWLLVGCQDSDAGTGAMPDAAVVDAGDEDASVTSDAGDTGDAGDMDASVGPDGSTPPAPSWLDDPLDDFPQTLTAVGLYPNMPATDVTDPRVVAYEPQYPLWSNGSRKARFALLAGPVEVDDEHGAWRFALGTVFFKTFYFGAQLDQPVETRVQRLGPDGWSFAVYRWDAGEAHLTDGRATSVTVEAPGGALQHEVPGRLACRGCHESSPSPVLGFRSLQLGEQRGRFGDLLPEVAGEPTAVEHPEPDTREVLGYLEGNCVPCHNGTTVGPNSTYDLSHGAALDNLIDQPVASSGTLGGTRVIPGDPDQSVLVLSMLGEGGADQMPPLGVQRVDAAMIDRIRVWIAGL